MQWALLYFGMALLQMWFFMSLVCAHCYNLDSSSTKYYLNVALQGLLWPITLPAMFVCGNPALLIR